jgi:hypothetical protein
VWESYFSEANLQTFNDGLRAFCDWTDLGGGVRALYPPIR